MNKGIKRAITVALAISAFSTFPFATNFMTTKVYASTSDVQLKSIYLSDGNIDFDKNDTSYSTSVSSSIDRVTITAKPEESNSRVRINGGTVTEDDKYKKTVNLSKGENKIEIDVQEHEEIRTYKLSITRGSATTDNQDPVYLKKLSIDGSSISLSKDRAIYDMQFNENVNEVKIAAEPEDSDYKVTINGYEIDKNDDFKKEYH